MVPYIYRIIVFIHVLIIVNLNCGLRSMFFVAYAPSQKGYKFYDPLAWKIIVTMDLTFFEFQLYFSTHLHGEYHVGEDLIFGDIEETRHQEEPDITINIDVRDLGEDINRCDPGYDRALSYLNDKNSKIELVEPVSETNKNGNREQTKNSSKKDQRFSTLPKVCSAKRYWNSRLSSN